MELLLLLLALAAPVGAQETGGSFGGSAWDDEPSGGGGGSVGSGSSSGGGGATTPSGESFFERRDREAHDRAVSERAAARRHEAETRRRIAEERARKLALPPAERIRELEWPEAPPPTPVSTAHEDVAARLPLPSWVPTDEAPEPEEPATPSVPRSMPVTPPTWLRTAAYVAAPLAVVLVALALLLTRRRDPWKAVADDAPPPRPHDRDRDAR